MGNPHIPVFRIIPLPLNSWRWGVTELLHRELTGKVIRVYYDVYNGLSRTYPEFIYENAMMRDLARCGIECSRQDEYKVFYKDWLVGAQRLDIFVAREQDDGLPRRSD